MLYGSFRESKSNTINMMGYDTHVLEAVVEFCQTNQLPQQLSADHHMIQHSNLEASIRQRVRVYHAADFLELPGLVELVHLEIRRLMGLYPGLSCVVFDEVDDTSGRLGDYARIMMEIRP